MNHESRAVNSNPEQWFKRAKMAQIKKLFVALHISGSIHDMIVIFVIYM